MKLRGERLSARNQFERLVKDELLLKLRNRELGQKVNHREVMLGNLFDLAADPGELTNLINSDKPEAKAAIKELDGKIREMMKEIDDPLLEKVGD